MASPSGNNNNTGPYYLTSSPQDGMQSRYGSFRGYLDENILGDGLLVAEPDVYSMSGNGILDFNSYVNTQRRAQYESSSSDGTASWNVSPDGTTYPCAQEGIHNDSYECVSLQHFGTPPVSQGSAHSAQIMSTALTDIYTCPKCFKKFSKPSGPGNRKRHEKNHCDRMKKSPKARCDLCPKEYSRPDALKRHQKIAHNKI